MSIWRLQCAWQFDTLFPRDAMVITPHFSIGGIEENPDQLCEDLADALQLWSGKGAQLTVKAYNAEDAPPVFPSGEAIRNVGASPQSNVPREVAVCLSFYSDRNVPRQRGRLYIPVCSYFTGTGLGVRPVGTLTSKPADLVPILSALGGVDVSWGVWSRRESTFRKATHYWVDDEWDTQRSRGLRSTARLQGSTGQ